MTETHTNIAMRTPEWINEIHFAFSMRNDGQMSFKRADADTVVKNRRRFLDHNSLEVENIVAGELVHGAGVAIVSAYEQGRGSVRPDWIPGVDGLVTTDPNVLLLTTHADCAPILMFDPNHKVIGQAHAGWRSLRAGVIERLALSVRSFNGTKPHELKAWIGPTVRPCCYPVGFEVAALFPPECRVLAAGTERLDLVRFIKMELARLDFDPASVVDSGVCTACDEEFSSFRRDGEKTAAMALVSGLKKAG